MFRFIFPVFCLFDRVCFPYLNSSPGVFCGRGHPRCGVSFMFGFFSSGTACSLKRPPAIFVSRRDRQAYFQSNISTNTAAALRPITWQASPPVSGYWCILGYRCGFAYEHFRRVSGLVVPGRTLSAGPNTCPTSLPNSFVSLYFERKAGRGGSQPSPRMYPFTLSCTGCVCLCEVCVSCSRPC